MSASLLNPLASSATSRTPSTSLKMHYHQPKGHCARRRRGRRRSLLLHNLMLIACATLSCLALLNLHTRPENHHRQQHEQSGANSNSKSFSSSFFALVDATHQAAPQLPLAQAQTSQPGNIYQTMSQMLQVFNGNGNDTHQYDTNNFKLLELADEDTLLVGARNVMYNLSLTTLREQRRLVWEPTSNELYLCQLKGKTLEQCQNFIRVIKRPSPDTLLVCGTSAFRPKCRHYTIGTNAYLPLGEDMPGEGLCPYQDNQNTTSIIADGQLFTAINSYGRDGIIYKPPLKTEQSNSRQLNTPNFVSSFRYGEHIYFIFREIAVEHINCGKTIYSRIGRVCINDAGGPGGRNRERWTSYVKARLNCSIPGEFPFHFDEVQASTHVVQSASGGPPPSRDSKTPFEQQNPSASQQQQQHHTSNQDLIYAVFTTPTNSIGGSAVCAFRMADVLAAFEGPFKGQTDSNSNWLPVPERRVPQSPRPGTCVEDSRQLSEEHLNFIKDTLLMDTTVEPIWSQPLITMASISFRFTQIAVDPQVQTQQALGAHGMRTDVIFVSTDDGRVFKLINTFHLVASHQITQHKTLTTAVPLVTSLGSTGLPHQPLAAAQQSGLSSTTPSQHHHLNGHAHTSGKPMAQMGPPPANQPEPLPDVSSNTIVLEELHLFDARTPITGLLIHRPSSERQLLETPAAFAQGKLIVMSSRQLKAVPLSRCERALSCLDCLSLYDPYCAWSSQANACLPLGRPSVQASSQVLSSPDGSTAEKDNFANQRDKMASLSSGAHSTGWFPANMRQFGAGLARPSNGTLGWWHSAANCPSLSSLNGGADEATSQPQQVGAPFRSLFSSHLQVPSRFDYQSGHHLSRAGGLFVAQQQQQQVGQASPSQSVMTMRGAHSQQPVSECLTFCGGSGAPGLYAPSGHSASLGTGSSEPALLNCAEYFNANPMLFQQAAQNQLAQTQNLYYTSENLYLAVIICAVFCLLVGLVFGFALGKNTRNKQESSICSSTFDETNLYMASTGSHGCHMPSSGLSGGLFAGPNLHHQSTVARLTNHPAFIATCQQQQAASQSSSVNNYMLVGSHNHPTHLNQQQQQQQQSQSSGRPVPAASMFETNQSLLAPTSSDQSNGIGSSTYANQKQPQQQQQLLFQHQTANNHERTPSMRTGVLPPIPSGGGQQQPTAVTHLSHAQLTPNSSTASQQTSSASSSGSQSTLQVSEQQQFYLNQSNNNNKNNNNNTDSNSNNPHQRTFTNSSSGSGGRQPVLSMSGKTAGGSSTFVQQQPNNKIYL